MHQARLTLPLLLLLAAAPAVRAEEPPAFPVPAALAESVEFWKRVWSEWDLGSVVLHDNAHPTIVYEVVALPGPIEDGYSDAQREFAKARREALSQRLAGVEVKVAAGAELDDEEKRLVLVITQGAGAEAIAGASERVRSQRGLRERFANGVAASGRWLPEFKRIFRTAGLPEDLAYLPHVESSFRADARSSVGALGMWQFMRSTGRKFLTITPAIDERLDPVASARGAAKYLAAAYARLESWPLAVTSYNHGVEGMSRAKERFGTDFEAIVSDYDGKYFGFASKNFYASFVAALELAKRYETAPPEGLSILAPDALDRLTLDRPATALSLARRYGVPLGELAAINPAWTKRAVRGNATLPGGVHVWLPEGTLEKAARAKAQRSDRFHVVRAGDTLAEIARRYEVRLDELVSRNGLTVSAVIRPGERLEIPLSR
ncbi:MAG TPA: transglycosylase SLT domain-containing protein [Candidatus Polarisedimenticolaceae bacterium]